MTERDLEPDSDQSEDDSGFLLITNAGVFAGLGDRKADHDACNTVGNMWSKARGGSIARTMRTQLEAKRAAAGVEAIDNHDTEREDTMPKTNEEEEKPKKRGDMLRLTLEAHEALSAKLGRQPSAKEVFDRLGPEIARSTNNVGITLRRLAARGDLKRDSTPGPKPKTAPAPRPAKKVRPAPRVVNGGGHHTSKGPVVLSRDFGTLPLRPEIAAKVDSDPVLAGIVRRRNELADKVAQLTHVIETW